MAVKLFTSTMTGAPTLSGTAGDLVNLLDQVMILGRGFAFDGNSLAFSDISAGLRQRGAGQVLLPQPAAGDIIYLGGIETFGKVIWNLTTVGVGGSYVAEYWNGAAWVPIVGFTDGTSGLTVTGIMQWAIDSQTGWVQVAVNGVTMYWIRVRCALTPSTAPEANLASIYGWGSPFQGTNGRTYRSELTNGVQNYFNVDDNAPATAAEARLYGAEVMSAFNTVTSGRFPTAAQFANGMFVRKSATANATVRAWKILLDEKTVYIYVLTGDTANVYYAAGFGEYFSLVPGDLYRSFVSARRTENNGTAGEESLSARLVIPNSSSTGQQGTYLARALSGAGGALLIALTPGYPFCFLVNATTGNVPTFNGADGGIIIGPVYMNESSNIRGRLRGVLDQAHVTGAWTDGDIFQGTGLLSTREYHVIKQINGFDQNGNVGAGVSVLETSDTWETN